MTDPTCDCCAGVAVRTPHPTENRPGLPEIEYRVGRHADFLASLIARLTDADRPALADLTTRDPDDFTIALLDGWATVADVLTFYNERLANESYLRTALDRTSLQELGKLIGYQLEPGAAAETYLAFAMEAPPDIPAAQSKDPGVAPSVTPAVVTLESGLRVQSIPGPDEKPQMFETVESIEARSEWNAIDAVTTTAWSSTPAVKAAWLDGVGLNLSAGDPFLLVGTDILGEEWDLRILEEVIADPEADRTEVRWTPILGSLSPAASPATNPDVFVLRKRVNVFGHNAPMWDSMTTEFRSGYPGGMSGSTIASKWPDYTISDKSGNYVDLDGSHPDIVANSWVVLSRPGYRELWEVEEVQELSRAEFAISGKVTRLKLKGGENYDKFDERVRDTTVYAVSEPRTLVEQPDNTDVSSDWFEVEADVTDMVKGRTLIVTGTTTSGVETAEVVELKSAPTLSGSRSRLTFTSSLANIYDRSTVVVHGNVALATHGESATEILGSGRAATPFQRFSLARTNPTFVQSSADPSGTETTLTVRVNGVAWKEADTLYDAEPNDQSYSVRMDEQGKYVVRFGEGVKGARLPTGSQNVVAEYRHGLGAAGNVGANSLAQLVDRPLGAKGVANPLQAEGGVDREAEEAARSTMPLKVRTLDRAVSLLDYADYARAYTGVSKSHATVLPLRGVRTIVVTVAFTAGTVSDPTGKANDLETSLRTFGDPYVEVKVVPHQESTFRLGMKVGVADGHDPDVVKKAVKAKIAAAFAFDNRDLTCPVHQSEVVAIVHQVAGIVAVDIDHMYVGTTPDLVDPLLPQLPEALSSGSAQPAGLIVIDTDPFDSLEVMT